MLTEMQRAELEALGPPYVRSKLAGYGGGRGAAIGGFACGEITRSEVEGWLIEKHAEDTALQQGTLLWAKIAGWASIVGVIVTIALGVLSILLQK